MKKRSDPPPASSPESGGAMTPGSAPEEVVEYAFPTKSRCPRCGSTDTKCYSTREGTQYRECRRPICRHKFQVRGSAI